MPLTRSAVLLAVLTIAACTGHSDTAKAWSAAVSPSVAGEENTIEVRDPQRAEGAMRVTLRMTDMAMPPVHVVLTRIDSGMYRAQHITFAMSGAWELDAPGHRIPVTIR